MKALKHVLLIDDNVNDNYIHTFTINKVDADIVVRSVLSGEEAIEFFNLNKSNPEEYPFPDLVFLDINMPGMNGFEFLEKAKKLDILKNGNPIIVIMLTSSLNVTDSRKASDDFGEEIFEYQNKPLTVDMFKEVAGKYFNIDY